MFSFRKFILLFFALVTYPINSYKMIVLTGGPCGGKTTSLKILQSKLEKIQGSNENPKFKVFISNEVATSLFSKGINPETEGIQTFQELIFKAQLSNENSNIEQAKKYELENPGVECIILCDRGLLDGAAYMEEPGYNKILIDNNLTKQQIFERYYAVVYLPSFSVLNNNLYDELKDQREKKEEAQKLDKKLYELWKNHKKFVEVSFKTKEKIAENILKKISERLPLL